ALTLGVLAGLRPLERRFFVHGRSPLVVLMIDHRFTSLVAIESAVGAAGLAFERIEVRPGYRPEQDRVEIVLSSPARDRLSGAVDRLCQVEGVREAKLLIDRCGTLAVRDRSAMSRWPPRSGGPTVAPTTKSGSGVVDIQAKGVADGDEGERPPGLIRREPLLGFREELVVASRRWVLL